MTTLKISSAAEYLGVHENTILRLAGEGRLRGAKIGRAWVFLEEDLIDYVRRQVREQSATRAVRPDRSLAGSRSAEASANPCGRL